MRKDESTTGTAEEPGFRHGVYRKSELAMLYFPYAGKKQAMANLNRWIRRCDGLHEALSHADGLKTRHFFLRPEVELIVKFLGEP